MESLRQTKIGKDEITEQTYDVNDRLYYNGIFSKCLSVSKARNMNVL